MESVGRKHNLQFPQHDDEECCGLGDSKLPQMDDNGDEVAMFLALVDRIRATNEILKQKRAACDAAEARSTAAGNTEAKIVTSKSPWKPAFVWEDFSYGDMLFGANSGSFNDRDFGNNNASASKEIRMPDIGSDEDVKMCLSDKHGLGSIDLNAEAPSEHPSTSALQFFH